MDRDTPADGVGGKSDGSSDDTRLTRRRLMASGAATWATVALAGCDRIDDPGTRTETDEPDDSTPGTGGTTVTNETTTTDEPDGDAPTTTPCEASAKFAPGMDIGIHVSVYDNESGDVLGADTLEGVTVEFPDADFEPRTLSWSGPHEEYSTEGWGGKVTAPEDAEPGTYRYEITVEGDGSETVTDQFTIV